MCGFISRDETDIFPFSEVQHTSAVAFVRMYTWWTRITFQTLWGTKFEHCPCKHVALLSSLTLMAPYRTFIKTDCGDRVLYLYGEPSAIYAVFGARRSITLAPVKLHLLCLKTPRQSSASYKVVVLQENGNWRQKVKMEREGGRVNTKYTNLWLLAYKDTQTQSRQWESITPLCVTGLELLFL